MSHVYPCACACVVACRYKYTNICGTPVWAGRTWPVWAQCRRLALSSPHWHTLSLSRRYSRCFSVYVAALFSFEDLDRHEDDVKTRGVCQWRFPLLPYDIRVGSEGRALWCPQGRHLRLLSQSTLTLSIQTHTDTHGDVIPPLPLHTHQAVDDTATSVTLLSSLTYLSSFSFPQSFPRKLKLFYF